MSLRLVIEDYEGSTTIVPLAESQVTIGRQDGNTIQLTEQNVSREHARLSMVEDRWFLEDLGSYNGVKVNAVPIDAKVELNEGDLITIADYTLVLCENAERAAALLAPRRAANDGDVVSQVSAPQPMVHSSADLPQVGPDPGMYSSDQMGAVPYEAPEEKTSKAAVFLVLIAAVVLGGVVWFALSRGNKDAESEGGKAVASEKADTPAAEAGTEEQPEVVPAAETEGAQEPEAEGGEDEPAQEGGVAEEEGGAEPAAEGGEAIPDAEGGEEVPDAEGGEEVPEPAAEGGETPEVPPAPKQPVKKKKKKKAGAGNPPPAPAGDPDKLLGDARKASMGGNASKAYKLAKQAYGINGSSEALQLMGVSACKMGDSGKAKAAYKKLSGSKKKSLKSLCSSKGIEL